ncbi:MAG: response regulator [Phycisphaeraceae bacterium]|nr:response regulator [Phycisphaeraceae bacterium]
MTSNPQAVSMNDTDFDPSGSVILVVDDNEQNVELLQAYLESMPVEVHAAYDGVEALNKISEGLSPDLILLDVMMPKMSGFEVCRKLKADDATAHVPVMMVTALNELGDIERGVEAGTDEFLSKPVNKLELLTRVKSLLRSAKLRQAGDDKDAYIRDLERMLGQDGTNPQA